MSPGCLLSGILMDKFGRKTTNLASSIPFLIGSILIYFATNIDTILFGRFLTGLSSGLVAPPPNVYISEICSPKHRSYLLAALTTSVTIGILIVHLLGTFLNWRIAAISCIAIPLVGMILVWFFPETPSWLAKKGRTEEAEKTFLWFRGDSKEEFREILKKQKDQEHCEGQVELSYLTSPEFWRPLAAMVFFFSVSQFSGINAVAFYSVTVMEETLKNSIDGHYATLIIDGVRVISSIIACVLLRQIGRKPILLISGVGTAISLFLLSAFSYLSRFLSSLSSNPAFPLSCLVAYIVFVTLGLMTLPWCFNGEVFPLKLRGFGSGVATCVCFTAFFVVVKINPEMIEGIGIEGTFLVYGCVALFGTLILGVVLPETKGKTLMEIERYFGKKEEKTVINS